MTPATLYGDKGEVLFVYSPTRSRSVIDKLLEGYQGVLHSDGYQAYNSFCKKTQGVIWAGCWAHTRRKFIEAEHLEPDKVKTVLGKLQALYKIEDEAGIKPKLLKELRASQSQTIVDELFSYFKKELDESILLPDRRWCSPERNPLQSAIDLHTRKVSTREPISSISF